MPQNWSLDCVLQMGDTTWFYSEWRYGPKKNHGDMVRSLIFSRWGHDLEPCNYGDMVRMLIIKPGHRRNGSYTQVTVFFNFKQILLEHITARYHTVFSVLYHGHFFPVSPSLASQILDFFRVFGGFLVLSSETQVSPQSSQC